MFDGLKYDPDQCVVHVWSAALDLDYDRVASFAGLLDGEEAARARRFHFERDRRRFTVARGILRTLLGRYLDMSAAALEFGQKGRGKPTLLQPEQAGKDHLSFNVSHSDGRALFAFVRGRELGVDLEAGARLDEDWPLLARRVFSAREQAELATVAPACRRAAFLDGWTRKEAYLKATAQGIVDGLASIEVTLDPGKPAAFVALPEFTRLRPWTLHNLRTDERFAATLVVEGRVRTVERHEFT